jgi:DNA polymerase-3 subunit alpha
MGERIEMNFDFEDSAKTAGKYLVFDTETTGLPMNKYAPADDFQNWPHVVQIAWLLFDDEHKLIESGNFYLKQPVEIPADAVRIHGITTEMMLEQGLEPAYVYARFKKAVDNTEYLIAHNVDFDVPILRCDFLRNGLQWDFPDGRLICTMKTGADLCKIPSLRGGRYKWPTLTELYRNCFDPGDSAVMVPGETPIKSVHNADTDAAMTARCFFRLMDLGFFKD